MIEEKKIHLILIVIAVTSCITASVITWHLLESHPERYFEGNPLSAAGFKYIGIFPTLIILWTSLIAIMMTIPRIFGKYKKVSIACNSCFAIILALDAGNNLYWLLQELYWIFGDAYQIFTPAVIILHGLYDIIGLSL